MGVSIHAPARGATWASRGARPYTRVSIHAPARGATGVSDADLAEAAAFQFTRPQGARQSSSHAESLHNCFNSRARKGRDQRGALVTMPEGWFQFTRPQGARRGRSLQREDHRGPVSIHAPARGATPSAETVAFVRTFQFTRPQGARHLSVLLYQRRSCFNSRARKGRDVAYEYGVLEAIQFQFTRPQGARLGL